MTYKFAIQHIQFGLFWPIAGNKTWAELTPLLQNAKLYCSRKSAKSAITMLKLDAKQYCIVPVRISELTEQEELELLAKTYVQCEAYLPRYMQG